MQTWSRVVCCALGLALGACASGGAVRPIASVRALEPGAAATIEGIVTVAPGTFASVSGDRGFSVEDLTGGISVVYGGQETAELGARVRVSGTLGRASKQVVLTAASPPRLLGAGQGVAPFDVPTGQVGPGVEGRLVRVRGRVSERVVSDAPYGQKFALDDGSGPASIFVHLSGGQPLIDTASLIVGKRVEVIGLASRYEDHFEVAPRRSADLLVVP